MLLRRALGKEGVDSAWIWNFYSAEG